MLEAKIPSDVVSQRHQYINSLKSFLEDQRKKLTNIYEELGFCFDDASASASTSSSSRQRKCDEERGLRSVCPYDKNHIIPEESFKSHTEICKLLKAGFQKDELPTQLQDVAFCYENKESIMTVNMDESLLNKIIWDQCVKNGQVYTGHRNMPVSYIDSNVNLTQEDRLAVYQYVVETSHKTGKVIKVDRDDDELLTTDWERLVKKGLLDEQSNQQYSSKLEQLAALRDLKRRRQTYRAKNVHITKKSYTQIIREVISNQMEILAPEKPGTTSTRESGLQEDDRSSRNHEKHESDWSKEVQEDEIRRDRKYNRSPEYYQRKRHSDDYRHRYKSRSNRESSSSDYRHDKRFVETEDSFDVRYEHSSKRKDIELREPSSSSRGYAREDADSPNRSSKRERKHSRSDSEEDGRSSDERHEKSKHKKTKHKKKHSKKHKKR